MSVLTRTTRLFPGFDCRDGHEAGHDHNGKSFEPGSKCEYGCNGDRWFFAVVEPDCGSTLSVSTQDLRGKPWGLWDSAFAQRIERTRGRPDYAQQRARGSDLCCHVAWPTSDEQVKEAPEKCDLLPGGACYSAASTSLQAGELFRAHGDPEAGNQPEAFWRALEDWHRAQVDVARRSQGRLHLCGTCCGRGVVES